MHNQMFVLTNHPASSRQNI